MISRIISLYMVFNNTKITKKYHIVKTVQKSNWKIVETLAKIDTPNTHTHRHFNKWQH
jgi:uncharacterized protein (DUF2344 family)